MYGLLIAMTLLVGNLRVIRGSVASVFGSLWMTPGHQGPSLLMDPRMNGPDGPLSGEDTCCTVLVGLLTVTTQLVTIYSEITQSNKTASE